MLKHLTFVVGTFAVGIGLTGCAGSTEPRTSSAERSSAPAPTNSTHTSPSRPAIKAVPATKPAHVNADHFAVLHSIAQRGSTWSVAYDRAYRCWGEAEDEPGCANPKRQDLDDGSWVVNNNPELTTSPASPSLVVTLYGGDPRTPFKTGVPITNELLTKLTVYDAAPRRHLPDGYYWTNPDGIGGIHAVIRYDSEGRVRRVEQVWMP